MQQFKVGDRVKYYGVDNCVIVAIEPTEDYPYLVWVKGNDETEWVAETDIKHMQQSQTVWAVCDEQGEVFYPSIADDKEHCLLNWKYMTGSMQHENFELSKSLTIRPFHLIPVND